MLFYELDKIVKIWRMKKLRRNFLDWRVFLVLKIIIVLLYSNLFVFKCFFYNYKGKLKSLIVKKMLLKLDLKKSEFLKCFFFFCNLFIFDFLFTIMKKNYDLLWWRKCLLKGDYVTYYLLSRGISNLLKYTWWSLMYQF